MTRLGELLSRTLTRGRDDAELDELAHLLDTYRRSSGGVWEPCKLDGRAAWRRELECGHVEITQGEERPQSGIVADEHGVEHEIELSSVCRSCYHARAEA